MIVQKEISLKPMRKGFHNIDDIVLKELGELPETAILNVFVKHTSAALMINENADPDVRRDIDSLLEKMAPESAPYLKLPSSLAKVPSAGYDRIGPPPTNRANGTRTALRGKVFPLSWPFAV